MDASSIENLSYSDNDPIVDPKNLEKIKELLSHRKDELGFDVEPILMITVKRDAKDEIEPLYWAKDEISIRDISSASEKGYQLDASSIEELSCSDKDPIVDPENLEKIKELLSHRKEEFGLECSRERKLARKERRKK